MDKDMIDQMYPDSKPKPDAETTTPVNDALESMYPEKEEATTGNPYALDEDKGSVEDNLYGANEKVTLSTEDDLTLIASNDEEREQLKSNLGHIASLSGATQQDMSSLIETCNEHIITSQTFDEADTMQTLYSQHGSELSAKLEAARTLVQSFSDLSEFLDSTGAGNNPKIINQIMKIAESSRAQERINKLMKQELKK